MVQQAASSRQRGGSDSRCLTHSPDVRPARASKRGASAGVVRKGAFVADSDRVPGETAATGPVYPVDPVGPSARETDPECPAPGWLSAKPSSRLWPPRPPASALQTRPDTLDVLREALAGWRRDTADPRSVFADAFSGLPILARRPRDWRGCRLPADVSHPPGALRDPFASVRNRRGLINAPRRSQPSWRRPSFNPGPAKPCVTRAFIAACTPLDFRGRTGATKSGRRTRLQHLTRRLTNRSCAWKPAPTLARVSESAG